MLLIKTINIFYGKFCLLKKNMIEMLYWQLFQLKQKFTINKKLPAE